MEDTQLTTDNLDIPSDFFCPITQEIMKDPVIAADSHSYEKVAIEEWFRRENRTSPLTNVRLNHTLLIPNTTLRKAIETLKSKKPILKNTDQQNFKGCVIKGRAMDIANSVFGYAKKKLVSNKNSDAILIRKYHAWFESDEYEKSLRLKMSEIIEDYITKKGAEHLDKLENKNIVQEICSAMLDIFYPDFWENKIGSFWQKTGCIRIYADKINENHIFNKLDEFFLKQEKLENREGSSSAKMENLNRVS